MSNPVAELKKRRNLTLTALADELGISKGHASDLVNGKEWPGKRTAKRLSELTGRPWWQFVAPPEGVP